METNYFIKFKNGKTMDFMADSIKYDNRIFCICFITKKSICGYETKEVTYFNKEDIVDIEHNGILYDNNLIEHNTIPYKFKKLLEKVNSK